MKLDYPPGRVFSWQTHHAWCRMIWDPHASHLNRMAEWKACIRSTSCMHVGVFFPCLDLQFAWYIHNSWEKSQPSQPVSSYMVGNIKFYLSCAASTCVMTQASTGRQGSWSNHILAGCSILWGSWWMFNKRTHPNMIGLWRPNKSWLDSSQSRCLYRSSLLGGIQTFEFSHSFLTTFLTISIFDKFHINYYM